MIDIKDNSYIPKLFIIPIAVLYGVFFTKLLNIIYGYEEINNQCNNIPKYLETGKNQLAQYNKMYQVCEDKKNKEIKDLELKQFNIMMVIGFIGIIVGVALHKQNIIGGNMYIAGAGLGIGGVMTLVYYIIMNWTNMNDKKRVVISGGILFSLIYASYKLLN